MNANQKKALQIHHPDLVRDLELRPDLIASFIHLGLFNEDMIDEFQAELTRKKQIQKMLSILPRRGPRAFDKFVRAIHDSYDWLAKGLRDTIHELSLKTDTGQISDKERVATYVHEHFGTSKRFCEDDKKDIRKFLLKQIRQNRDEPDGLQRQESMETDSDVEDEVRKDAENELLKKMYELLFKNSNGGNTSPRKTPVVISISIIEDKINELNGKVNKLEEEISDCYNAIGAENHDIPLQNLVQTLVKDKQRSAKLQDDLNNLEKQRKGVDIQLELLQDQLKRKTKEAASIEHENEKLHQQKKELVERCDEFKEKCEKLEKIHIKHVEKQQTLMALKSMVSELSPQTGKSMQESFSFPTEHSYKYECTDEDKHHRPKMRLSLPRIKGAHNTSHHEHPKHIRKINQHPSITKAKEVYEHPWK